MELSLSQTSPGFYVSLRAVQVLKEFADGNFSSNENGIKLSKRIENTEETGEIARYEQFLLFSHCLV